MKTKKEITYSYLMFDGTFYKIGKSIHPEQRIKEIKTGNPTTELIMYSSKVDEKFLHEYFNNKKVKGEWFELDENDLSDIKILMEKGIYGKKYKTITKTINEDRILVSNGTCNIVNVDIKKHTKPLTFNQIKKSKDAIRKKTITYSNYIIDFGKYKDREILTMTETVEIDYLIWYIKNSSFTDCRRFRAIKWYINTYLKLKIKSK